MLPIKDDMLASIRAERVRKKLFANRSVNEGRIVTVRLNLNYKVKGEDGIRYSIQTIHDGKSPTGKVLGYDSAASLKRAVFVVDQEARARIAGGAHKFPMAGVVGQISHEPPSLDGIEVRFNPKTSHLFTRVDDGRAVYFADEVTVFHTRVYARGELRYWGDSAPQPLEGIASDALV